MTTPTDNALDALAQIAPAAPVNREDWLRRLADALRPWFADRGFELPEAINYSCGWTSTGRRSTRVGEHWGPEANGSHEIFISPRKSDGLEVAAILAHELVHAAVFPVSGHGPDFRECATAVGLEGPMRSTHAGAALAVELQRLIDELGAYPHTSLGAAALIPSTPRQTNRQILCWCTRCGYRVRAARNWLDIATPLCPMPGHGSMVREDTRQTVEVVVQRDEAANVPTVSRQTLTPSTLLGAEVAELSGRELQERTRPELVEAPFTVKQWALRAIEALGGESVEVNDVESFILVEATNRELSADVATERTARRVRSGRLFSVPVSDTARREHAASRFAVARPSRTRLVASMRDLVASGHLEHAEIEGTLVETLFCLTDKGRTEDPEAAPEATEADHAAAVERRGNRFAAALAENLVDDSFAEQAAPAERAGRSNRFAALDLDDAPTVEAPETPAAAPRSRRFAALDI